MVIAKVTRPKTGKVTVRIPYTGHSWEGVIRSILPTGSQVTRGPRSGDWLVGRNHLGMLVAGLMKRPGIEDIDLALYQGREGGCSSACYTGSDSDEAIMMCQCACVGLNHGTQSPPAGAKHVATVGGAGEVYRYPGGVRRVRYSRLRDEFR